MRQIAVGNQPVFSQPPALPLGVCYHRFRDPVPDYGVQFQAIHLASEPARRSVPTSVVLCPASVQHLEAGRYA
jgi:hypothetical protein